MKVLIYIVILIAVQAGAQGVADKNIDCALVRCAPPVPPVCPRGTVLTKITTPRPGRCCDLYECKQDCTTVKCGSPLPVRCPADSILIKGITLPGQCCPQPGRCQCKPAGCVKKECRPGFASVLVSPGSGLPGDCCGIYECKPVMNCAAVRCARPVPPVCPPFKRLIKHDIPRPWDCCNPYECIPDCRTVKCGWPLPKICPEDSVWSNGVILPGQCCPQPGRCECKPDGCVKKECRPGYISVLVSPGSGIPGDCCGVYECKPDCSSVMCPAVMPPPCPSGTMLVKRNTPVPGDCCNIYECKPVMDCATVRCARPEPPVCLPGTMLIEYDIPRPWDCCNPYECIPDCTTIKCGRPFPESCPEDSVLIEGITLPGQCCPQPNRCECKPAGCVEKKCRPGYVSVLVSPGSGKPGDCCDVYECKPDCSLVMCPDVMPPPCPPDNMLVKRDIPTQDDCCAMPKCRPVMAA